MKNKIKSLFQYDPDRSKGQTMVLIAVAFVVLLAFIGITVDVGQLFITMGQLRRATDAASLAAAAQIREGRSIAELQASAWQVMDLNGVVPTGVTVETCLTNPGDPELCTTPRRKLVRVTAQAQAPMSFLYIVGLDNITVTGNSISEAASMDVVLVLDVGESMAFDASCGDGDDDDGDGLVDDCNPAGDLGANGVPDDFYRDPSECNADTLGLDSGDGLSGECFPLEEVKRAAINFVDRILNKAAVDEEDRVAIIAFSNGWETGATTVVTPAPGWTRDKATARAAIANLSVYDPLRVCPADLATVPDVYEDVGACRAYSQDTGWYLGFDCPLFRNSAYKDLSTCTTTNIGGGLQFAGGMFAVNTREQALWVVVVLTDGAVNTTFAAADDDLTDATTIRATLPLGHCPLNGPAPPVGGSHIFPPCRDDDATTHHLSSVVYDAEDYARDQAKFVACLPVNPAALCVDSDNDTLEGQGAIVFAIGMGDFVITQVDINGVPYGASLLRYIAAVGYDGNPGTDLCASESDWTAWCGNYYYSPTTSELPKVFEDIASRIFTRITH